MKIIEHERSRTESTAIPVRAAEYVRMSTEGQQYSIPRQQAAIREYAEQHSMTVVRTYADPGRSGLQLKNRPGLIQLLDDVQHGAPDFDVVLVYDVSRWGRFQDTDESGFYEYMCRRAGVRVEYCVELFENDGGPLASILKNIKRIMAAEYSREQSTRVHRSICAAVMRGHYGGGAPNYGLRRILVGPDGKSKGILVEGETRAMRSDHMLLTLGPPDELATVRRIFRLFIKKRLSPPAIAKRLNAKGSVNRVGRPWRGTSVREILESERYAGTLTYNKTTRLSINTEPRRKNADEHVIRVPNCFPAIISQATFDAARQVMRKRSHGKYTDEQLLDRLRQLLREHGRLTQDLLRAKAPPDPFVYSHHFGSLANAYALIGYEPRLGTTNDNRKRRVGLVSDALLNQLAEAARLAGADVVRKPFVRDVVINRSIILSVRPALFFLSPGRLFRRWRVDFSRQKMPTFTVIARIDECDERALDFFLMPAGHIRRTGWNIGPRIVAKLQAFHCPTTEDLTRRLLAEIHRAGKPAPSNN